MKNKNKTSKLIITGLKENEYIKKRYKKLTINLFNKDIKQYNYIKILILIDNIQKGFKKIAEYNPNNAGTGMIFKMIENDIEFQSEANKIFNLYKKIKTGGE